MPFDGVEFQKRRRRQGPATPGERLFRTLFLLLAICMLVLPISMAGLVDIVRYLRGH